MSKYETHRMKDPRLPLILHRFTYRPHHRLGLENWHENIELFVPIRGSGVVMGGELPISVTVGEIAVINTGCLHTMLSEEGISFYCLIIDRSFCIANHFDTNAIRFDSWVRDEELYALIEQIADEYFSEEESLYRVQAIRALVLHLMVLLCRRYGHVGQTPLSDSRLLASIKYAIGYIRAESHRDLSLDEVAMHVGLSKFYFAREFRRITGYTFVAYVNQIRCEKAKTLLAEDQMTVGEVARACGFANQSYFSRTFLRLVGELPSAYRTKSKDV
ncbi:MAG: helix-turn-helix domain-containing protein [Ruminococcaceae bacterium]|nr:helix-turn-helix domain-containing protein [Oscillospiraceae bacterium]